jgi:hypothetical protein
VGVSISSSANHCTSGEGGLQVELIIVKVEEKNGVRVGQMNGIAWFVLLLDL